mgnify:CR=1 FL=1
MIGKNYLKVFEFQSIEEFFSYVVESQINGNHSQAKELFKKMNSEQKNDFYDYLIRNEIKFDYTNMF